MLFSVHTAVLIYIEETILRYLQHVASYTKKTLHVRLKIYGSKVDFTLNLNPKVTIYDYL